MAGKVATLIRLESGSMHGSVQKVRKCMKVGLQLFTIRADMAKDMDVALKEVKKMGYNYVEFSRFFDYTAEEIRAMLDKYQLECFSVHQHLAVYEEKGEEIIEFIKTLGAKYWVIPKLTTDRHKGSAVWEQTKKSIAELSKVLKKHGIILAYHNHEHEFNCYEGKYLLDWLFEEVPTEILQPQLDLCWVKYAGVDPVEYIRKYSGKMDTIHFRDFTAESFDGNLELEYRSSNGFKSKPVGYGVQDFVSIVAAAKNAGVKYAIVEADGPTLEDARLSLDYLKSIR